ncbi:D-alanyl-D-alanine carboxypeptidase (penicillin-binding protein 5/6) [Nonomuraea polychroma]|uniref:D-alanyl-D-alanine carboxypeptidase (Penicillin-binding protein 5/6) n=1 Tax=Nonomuraea polychroma TaxID=46176 RepID=A0A438M9Y2_9ACTN|nr:serine hydrolase [Nonomuraea polychroma]RVX42529.1 D-alanyl-D-alanine carboxypeptidase (penicillin-binding protein 5/6) [Nonomuraea polychroma]
MRTWKAITAALAGILTLATGLAAPAHASASALLPAAAAVDTPTVYGRAAYLIDASSGKVLFDDNGTERMPIASLTKTMTAYVVLKTAKPTDVVQIAPADVSYAEDGGGTTADLRAGDRLTVNELLYGLMLPSGADAAHALARTYGPGVDGFVAKMNATARQLGMADTQYVNADGLPMPGSDGYSTARDQALLAAKALELPLIKETAGTRYHSLDANGEHRSYSWRNTNRLLRTTPDAIGLKTGFTRAAGFCLAFASEQDGQRLVGVLLGESDSSRRFATAEELLTWGASRQAA